MKETGLTGKRRSTTIAATPDDGKSQRKRRRRSRWTRGSPNITVYGGIKGCKTIPEVRVAIRLPESKMAAKMAAKMKQTLKTFSMQYAHLSVDIQLYHIACIVQWSDSYCWTSLVLHPGMMHTLMSFLGCIGTLMKASCVDMLLIVAFGGVADIITGNLIMVLGDSLAHLD